MMNTKHCWMCGHVIKFQSTQCKFCQAYQQQFVVPGPPIAPPPPQQPTFYQVEPVRRSGKGWMSAGGCTIPIGFIIVLFAALAGTTSGKTWAWIIGGSIIFIGILLLLIGKAIHWDKYA